MKKNAAFYSTAMVVGVLLTFLYIFFGNTKIGYDGDELFSYMSSNMEGGYKKMLAYEDNAWHDTQIFGDALTVKEDNRFQYKMVAENQADDTHPPLYYFMLHTICSFFPNQFSKWFGISLNIVLMLASLVLIYFIAEHFLKNRWLSLTIAACFGATYGAINLVLFIRMYTLLLFLHTLLFYFTVRFLEEAEQNNGKLTAKWFVTQFLIVWLGTMTQYYFLIYYFFTSAVLCLALIWKKYWKLFVQYAAVSGIAGVVSCALYPIMLKHIFGGYRGRESAHKLIKGQGFGQDLKTMWAIMDRQLFNRHFGELLLILFVVTIILFVLKKTDNGKIRKLFWMSVPNFLFFLVIVRIAPYMIDRYIVPVYAVVFLLVSIWFAGVCKVILEKTSWKKYYAVPFLIIVLLSVHRMGNVEQSRYWYEERYKALAENTEGIADCMYVSGDIYNWKMWGKFLEFQQYDRLYFVDGTKWNPMSLEESGEKMVLYVDKAISEDVWKSYLTEYTQYSKYSPVYSEDYLDVYVMEKE